MVIKIAFRNALKHIKRNLLIIVTIVVGVVVYITMDSLYNGIDRMFVEGVVNFSDSSITIYPEEYDKNRKGFPISKGVKSFSEVENIIRNELRLKEITYRTQFLCEVIFGNKSKYIVGIAIEPEKDKKVFKIIEKIKGEYLKNKREILIGGFLAKSLGVGIGDYVTISTKTVEGIYNAMEFKIVGIVETGNALVDESSVLISYESANELLNLGDIKTSLHVKVEWHKGEWISSYTQKVEKIASKLRTKLKGYTVYTFKDLHGYFLELMKQGGVDHYFLMAIILIIAGVGISNTIIMSIYERNKEIGILMTIGINPRKIRSIFVTEGIIIGTIGGVIGLIFGVLFNLLLVNYGLDLSIFGGSGTEWGIPTWGVIYGVWNTWSLVICFVFVLLISLISSYLPSRHISKLKVVECLKFQ
ncbi:MAG: FtsX-like permease family protein [Brevinematales bacterium]|nr:FtsX-like permease family protein [Brevinematales bacterium]